MNNKSLITGLASALVVSVIGALSVSQASEQAIEAAASEQDSVVTQTQAKSQADDQPAEGNSVQKVGETQAEASTPSVTQLYSHQMDGKAAVTLYVRQIPIVTFLGDSATASASEQTKLAGAENVKDPMWRATKVAAKINQLQQSDVQADAVRVIWDKQQKAFVIRAQDEQLLAMNSQTILPNTTKNVGDDALKITNLLRRQLGNASPLTEIPGRPKPKIAKPKPKQNVAVGSVRYQLRGQASWYGGYFHGRKTASGERYNQNALTAAHKTLRFGTRVRVTNLNNGRSVVVRINDRGPFIRGRIIDMSRRGAQAIGLTSSGVAPVRVDVLK